MRMLAIMIVIGMTRLAAAGPVNVTVSGVTAPERAPRAASVRGMFANALARVDADGRPTYDVALVETRVERGGTVAVTIEVRVVVSDARGLHRLVCATAQTHGPTRTLAELRDRATADAIAAIVAKLPRARTVA